MWSLRCIFGHEYMIKHTKDGVVFECIHCLKQSQVDKQISEAEPRYKHEAYRPSYQSNPRT